jgi:hypothetical protein
VRASRWQLRCSPRGSDRTVDVDDCPVREALGIVEVQVRRANSKVAPSVGVGDAYPDVRASDADTRDQAQRLASQGYSVQGTGAVVQVPTQ